MPKIKYLFNNYSLLQLTIPFFFIFSMFYCLFLQLNEQNKYEELQNKMMAIPVIYPTRAPIVSNDSIGLAIALFSIDTPNSINSTTYSSNIPYRGLTIGNCLAPFKEVLIGNMAFENWGILGSTLGHEIEIHGNQSFLKIEFLNYIYSLETFPEKLITIFIPKFKLTSYGELGYGSYNAEKEAYSFEINSKKRFNLSNHQVNLIRNVLDNDLI